MFCDPVTDFTAGGTISTLRFAEFLRQRGHNVIFAASKAPGQRYVDSYKGFKVYRSISLALPRNERQFRISFPVRKRLIRILEAERIDIVHFMLPHPAAIAAIRAARSVGAKVVAHSHTQPENILFHPSNANFKSPLGSVICRYLAWLYRQADAVVFPSEFARHLLEDRLGLAIKKVVISNGVDTRYFKPTVDSAPHPQALLSVGRLHPEKAIDTLISAIPLVAQCHPEVRLSIVGRGYLGAKLQGLTRSLRLEGRVTFHGTVAEGDLILMYNACAIFVLPSWAELEGMALLEAMACGKPIVVANSPHSAAPLLVEGNGLLFKPGNPEDLAKKLATLLDDAPMRVEMGRISRARSENYDIRMSVDKLEELYDSLLS